MHLAEFGLLPSLPDMYRTQCVNKCYVVNQTVSLQLAMNNLRWTLLLQYIYI